ncbi:PREDICTED: uncharacterized protein LOC105360783 [Ceratosolen solmsi marchali]|uniref:Uncharacterized protein LOC105360783 n=1 Tax=Ceratosolen solmsi marchali TaxID=326594 RepID=A0AAJ6YDK2_9HYME|nr:PREDICTED: uncharacterized protein LOC105360783 [Ceratosolen solmsi marchali]
MLHNIKEKEMQLLNFKSDFQPLITSSHFNTQDIKREYVVNDNLFSNKSKPNSTSDQQNHQQPLQTENVTTYDEIFGPPPLSKVINYSKPKSKVTSLFDDSESEDDLFISASPDTKSLKSIDRTPSKTQTEKKKSLFDNDDNLFGSKDEPDVDLFAVTPVKSLSQVPDKLFDDNDKPVIDSALFDKDTSQFAKTKTNTDSDLFGEISNTEKVLKYSTNSLFKESLENDSKASCDNLFEKDLATGGNNLFEKNSKGIDFIDSENQATKQSVNNLFEESTKVNNVSELKGSNILFKDSEDFLNSDLFGNIPTQKSTISKNIFGSDSDSDLFATTSNSALKTNIGQHSSANLFDDHKTSLTIVTRMIEIYLVA